MKNPKALWKASIDGREAVALNQETSHLNLLAAPDGSYSLISASGKSLEIKVEEVKLRERLLRLRVDGKIHEVQLFTPLDQLIDELGLEANPAPKLSAVHAPMPGLVLRVEVEEGQEVETGQTLLVLEAMKMENAIKAPAAAKVSHIEVQAGQAVDKGALLLKFDS